ncbi:olfactory receptor 2L3-like [Erethizon dorsatum]
MENYTQTSTDFILLGLFPPSRVSLVLFILIVPIFLMALAGNLSMVLLILLDAHLHTPMYVLLSQLSLMDLMYISTTVPKMASGFLFENRSISFTGCGFQSFSFLTTAGSEGLILMSMAYDRYVAICFPLHYPVRMNRRVCVLTILASWGMGPVNSCAHTVYALHIPYCRSRAINHFFCDVPAMLTLASGDTRVHEYTVFLSTVIFLLFPFIVIVFSYGKVLLAVYRMHSREGRKKAYSTCSTHLTVVTFYYAPFAYTYLRPKSLRSPAEDKVLAVFYTIFTPMLNPVIYSLRNKEVMGALGRVSGKFCSENVEASGDALILLRPGRLTLWCLYKALGSLENLLPWSDLSVWVHTELHLSPPQAPDYRAVPGELEMPPGKLQVVEIPLTPLLPRPRTFSSIHSPSPDSARSYRRTGVVELLSVLGGLCNAKWGNEREGDLRELVHTLRELASLTLLVRRDSVELVSQCGQLSEPRWDGAPTQRLLLLSRSDSVQVFWSALSSLVTVSTSDVRGPQFEGNLRKSNPATNIPLFTVYRYDFDHG